MSYRARGDRRTCLMGAVGSLGPELPAVDSWVGHSLALAAMIQLHLWEQGYTRWVYRHWPVEPRFPRSARHFDPEMP